MPNKFDVVLSLIEYFREDIEVNSDEVTFLLNLAKEQVLGSQNSVEDFNLILEEEIKQEVALEPVLKIKPKNPIKLPNKPLELNDKICILPSQFERLIKLNIKIR